ncbi:MAG: inorganic phosphate transporter [Hamadaea sp.]|uniref:inorganic phosphate transporter n=1 Tax=Hamadaea sp. TaxID=2024425 RepID=UPI0017F69A6B|nr:inorganic phosphate transporter [Hamadaea sp.]NUO56209.1 inorganic phosphate transporter [Hamadaea sp.]NUR46600.1 inorganic phosphate transporter [Hamadaea sp.]NUR74357.1 inorganic phosphate transporter [Hamadaea sp.]NUT01934.1 inorganic phosphate transporter [Hamadaea sp.]NUT20341.1 inorganic phosphate transporter [Hamadaea sp.]
MFWAVFAVIAAAMIFDYTNGFHDAANAIATSVSTRALTPRVALLIAALGNFIGTHFGAKVAATVGKGLVTLPAGEASLGIVLAGVIGAIGWNLLTWYFGIPSSSTHALFGGLVGATLAGIWFGIDAKVLWSGLLEKVVYPMVLSPVVGFILGAIVMVAVMWIFRKGHPGKLNRGFRIAQTISAAAMSIGHGMQDAAKTMGIIVLALYVGGYQDDPSHIPGWVYYTSATVLALGTYAGGWRVIRTLGRKIIDLGPAEGFAAETVASSVLYYNALVLGAPISTTHTITSAIMGVGATKKLSAVRWGVAGNIVTAWVLTFPGAALISILAYLVIRPIF